MKIKDIEAKKQFQHALDNQKTINISKLKKLMKSMKMSLGLTDNIKVKFLEGENKKLISQIMIMERQRNKRRRKNNRRKQNEST